MFDQSRVFGRATQTRRKGNLLAERLARRFGKTRYDRALASLDATLAPLLGALPPDTIVVLHGDHGERLVGSTLAYRWYRLRRDLLGAERTQKLEGHETDVYEDLIRVTLALTAPGRLPAGGTVEQLVRQVDLTPTILDLLGLPIPPGEPAINPVPRRMIREALGDGDYDVTIAIRDGARLAEKTWNPRLGIVGGLSVLGTTGIVVPYSCAAWIASIHRGIDVARAMGLSHVVGSTGDTSERAAMARLGLPVEAYLDMGDFAGGLLKYLKRHPVERLTIAGGFAKLVKLAQGAMDLHSGRSSVDFEMLAGLLPEQRDAVLGANTANEVLALGGNALAAEVARLACAQAQAMVGESVRVDVLVVDRAGMIVGESG